MAQKKKGDSAPQCYISNALSVAIEVGHTDIVELLKVSLWVSPREGAGRVGERDRQGG